MIKKIKILYIKIKILEGVNDKKIKIFNGTKNKI